MVSERTRDMIPAEPPRTPRQHDLWREAERRRFDDTAFDDVQRILRGSSTPPLDALSSKTLRVLLSSTTDTEISPGVLYPRVGTRTRREASTFRWVERALQCGGCGRTFERTELR